MAVKHVEEFLTKASEENDKIESVSKGNISNECLTAYKRIMCKTFVPTCSESSNINQKSCEEKLQW